MNVQIIDSATTQPIPYTNIYFSNNNGLISDDNGNFELIKSQLSQNDSMYISMLGYKKSSFLIKDFNDTIIQLIQTPIKLSDVFLTNKKLNRFEKFNQSVLCADNKIIWLCGHRIDDRYKVSDETTKFISLNRAKRSIV